MYRPDEGWLSCDGHCETCTSSQNLKCGNPVADAFRNDHILEHSELVGYTIEHQLALRTRTRKLGRYGNVTKVSVLRLLLIVTITEAEPTHRYEIWETITNRKPKLIGQYQLLESAINSYNNS